MILCYSQKCCIFYLANQFNLKSGFPEICGEAPLNPIKCRSDLIYVPCHSVSNN